MLYQEQTRSKFDASSLPEGSTQKLNLAARLDVSELKAYSITTTPNLGLLDSEKKKEQFLTIDRF